MSDKEKKASVLLPKPVEAQKNTGEKILDKAMSAYPKYVRMHKLGIGGDIVAFKREGNKPPVVVDWTVGFLKGAGKKVKSKALRKRIRGKRAPRFKFRVKF